MIDYIEYGKWEGREVRCRECSDVIESSTFSWTVEYDDGDTHHFHQECIDGESARLMDYLAEKEY